MWLPALMWSSHLQVYAAFPAVKYSLDIAKDAVRQRGVAAHILQWLAPFRACGETMRNGKDQGGWKAFRRADSGPKTIRPDSLRSGRKQSTKTRCRM